MRKHTVHQRGDKQKAKENTVHFFLEKNQSNTYDQETETTVQGPCDHLPRFPYVFIFQPFFYTLEDLTSILGWDALGHPNQRRVNTLFSAY